MPHTRPRCLPLLSFLGAAVAFALPCVPTLSAQDSVSFRFVDADLRTVAQSMARYLPKPLIINALPSQRVSLETSGPIPQAQVLPLLAGLLRGTAYRLEEDSAYFTVLAIPAPSPPAPAQAKGTTAGPLGLHVLRLRHARAADVASTINLLFGGIGSDYSGRTGLSSGTLTDQLQQPRPSPAPAGPAPASQLAGPVFLVPDELTNSLLLRASPDDAAVITDAVEKLDVRPLQVLIEVLIVEARKDRTWSLGTSVKLPPQDIGGDGTISGQSFGGGLGDLVISIMRLGRADVDAILRTAQAKGDVNIVSRPVLLASNNVEARFLVGAQRPFVQVSRTQPTDGATRDQVVQYRDVGTKLTVRPTINRDGYVSLLVQQEISTATDETQFDAPVISTREASTQVFVKDGQTIILGGLRDRESVESRSGIPVLSGIPIIGGLFGSWSKRKTEVELFLFLTPRILATDTDAEAATATHSPGISPHD